MTIIYAGFDCEATGLQLFHGDLPFMACMSFSQPMKELGYKNQVTWEWPVDPMTRTPMYDVRDLVEIVKWLQRTDIIWIGHNIKYDVRCVVKAIEQVTSQQDYPTDVEGAVVCSWIKLLNDFDPLEFLDRCHDTMFMSHAIDNRGSHGLKDLGIRYLNIGEDDKEAMQRQVESCYPLAESLGWKIACAANCPTVNKKPNDGWWVMDMWLPAATFKYLDEYNEDHFGSMSDQWKQLYHSLMDHAGNLKNLTNVYCLRDTYERTLHLGMFLMQLLQKENLWEAYMINQVQSSVAYTMEEYGLPTSIEAIDTERHRLRELAEGYRRACISLCHNISLNLNAPSQVAYTLMTKFGVKIERYTALDQPTVDKDEAEELYRDVETDLQTLCSTFPPESKEVQVSINLRNFLFYYLAYKKCTKVADQDLPRYRRNAYKRSDGITVNRFNFNVTGTDTVRYSSEGGQNIGKGKAAFNEGIKALGLNARKVFHPTPGYKWYCIDGKQMQIVIAAYRSGVKFLKEAVERGDDLHEVVHLKLAELLGWTYNRDDEGQRTIAKNCNLGYLFGAGEDRVDEQAHTSGLYQLLKQNLPEAHQIIKADIKFVKANGYIMAGPYRLYTPPDKPYAATVYSIQGLEGVIIKRAMRSTYEFCKKYPQLDCRLIHQNHDELITEVPLEDDPCVLPWLQYFIMEAGIFYGVPCKADVKVVTTNWSEGKKVSDVAATTT